uniref:Uncharacterized protein n=1 Tax=Nonomuraea gerenzanensis TaxID=93944 RepID=A0A1M4DXZ6_9ACTN|nr:hypothetical protein BN4615_P949 [Nonomuraea gerenzanensis]
MARVGRPQRTETGHRYLPQEGCSPETMAYGSYARNAALKAYSPGALRELPVLGGRHRGRTRG